MAVTDADIVREALNVLNGRDFRLNGCVCAPESKCYLHEHYVPAAVKALDRLEALSQIHVTQATRDMLVAEGWLDPEQARNLRALEAEHWVRVLERDKRVALLEEALRRIAHFPFDVMRADGLDLHDVKEIAREALGGVRGGEEQRA